MRYLKSDLFLDYKGQPKEVGKDVDPVNPERKATTGDVLAFIADQYVPQQGFQLTLAEIRKLNKAIDVLYTVPVDGVYRLEDEDFAVLSRTAQHMVLLMGIWSRSAPEIEDIIESATTKEAA